MVTEFKLPKLGEGIESGDVLNILVDVGDSVTQDQPVMEIKSDKATVTKIFAPISGIIREIHVEKGKRVEAGQLLLIIDEEDEKEESEPRIEAIGQESNNKE